MAEYDEFIEQCKKQGYAKTQEILDRGLYKGNKERWAEGWIRSENQRKHNTREDRKVGISWWGN